MIVARIPPPCRIQLLAPEHGRLRRVRRLDRDLAGDEARLHADQDRLEPVVQQLRARAGRYIV
jgi:hypothetical protein